MRLIEKKCPNCGADLEFDENAKSCKCNYCKRSFEIERDVNDLEKINLVFDKVEKPVKAIFIIPFVFAFAIILLITFSIIFGFVHSTKNTDPIGEPDVMPTEEKKIVSDVEELTKSNMDTLEMESHSMLNQSVTGRNDTTYSYQRTGDPRLEKTYVVAKDEHNYIILIYNVKYHNFFNQSDQQTVYVPVVFEDVYLNHFVLTNPTNPAPEYYLNEDHSTYIYAFDSLESAYRGVIEQYEKDYTITEK